MSRILESRDMAGLRIEVGFKDPELDSRSQKLRRQVAGYLGKTPAKARVIDVYYLDIELGLADAERVAQDLLADPILEEHSFTPRFGADADWLVEVGGVAGLTDNVGRTTAEAVADMLNLDRRADFVRSGTLYALAGDFSKEEIDHLCLGLLANPLVNVINILSRADYPALTYRAQALGSAHKPRVDSVRLPETDEGLETLSREKLLALTAAEMRQIRDYFGREDVLQKRVELGLPNEPTDIELETLAQTWSEHCKHKIFNARITYTEPGAEPVVIDSLFSTFIKAATEKIAREKDWLVSVFTDNAGIISLSERDNIVFKVETHNHPSALDPYGGALTGILGVNRDPMGTGLGAELIFNTDVFCFGLPDKVEAELPEGILHPRRIFNGVRQGVEDGGNKVGVPTVNGAILFDERYTYNPLVFCGTGGIMPKTIDGVDTSLKPIEPGDLIVMVGGRIGKDGIHGATFSSIKLEEETPPAVVQIGAPIVQKKMMDALLEARDRLLYRTLTDNGAGGLSSSIGEMAELCGGADVDLEKAPLKYPGLDPWEIWVSESQERMTLAVPPEKLNELLALLDSRDVEATAVGKFTNDGYLTIRYDGEPAALLDIDWLHGGLPPLELVARWEPPTQAGSNSAPISLEPGAVLKRILGSLNVCSKESVIRQYDHEVQGMSVVKPLVGIANDGPSDGVVLKPRPDAPEGVVTACGINPKLGLVDTYSMAVSALDEAVRNVVAVGADPDRIAVLDNFCWGNPILSKDNPDGDYKLAQLVRAARGCHDAAVALGTPFISGKDSFHNEYDLGTEVVAIPPTLLVSAMGMMADAEKAVTMDAKRPGDIVYVIGTTDVELGGSHYAEIVGIPGQAPGFDGETALAAYRRFHQAVTDGLVASAHDASEGGLAVAFAETAFAGGHGLEVNVRSLKVAGDISDVERLFSESNSRLAVTVSPDDAGAFERVMADSPCARIGKVTDTGRLVCVGVDDRVVIDESIEELKAAWQAPLKDIG